ncbi:hypothetical protein DPEC_G00353810 [Dallia pectoralis]|uniref:Uncharacterized protein n=1 Tax=Dallia pectoralis TaxID=75939 RepID=A0ACC2F2N6_DALPE|nr:hypothetical protein DPEC_G00353810 [Dallia pectoralis]
MLFLFYEYITDIPQTTGRECGFRMQAPCPPLKQALCCMFSTAADLYSANNRQGWRDRCVLFITCLTFSLVLSSTLVLYLLYLYDRPVAIGISCSCFVVVATTLFLSKEVRCFSVLFVLSFGMRQSRNVLIAVGTSLVFLNNVQNALENVTGLTESVVCNLQAKRLYIDTTPLNNYVHMLKWVGRVLGGFTDFGVARLVSHLDVTSDVDSEKLRLKLAAAARTLNGTAESFRATLAMLSTVGHKLFPAFSVLFLMVFTFIHLRRYRLNKKYENRYITRTFVDFDEKQKAGGCPHVLPLTRTEARRYMTTRFTGFTALEGKAILRFALPVATHCFAWVLLIGVDALMFWFVEVIRTRLQELEPFDVPLIMNMNEDVSFFGVPISTDLRRRDFSYQVSLFEKKCLPNPRLLLYDSIVPLAGILSALLVMVLMSAKLTQIRLDVCERFFSTNAEERVKYLHAKILKMRSRRDQEEKAEEISLRSLLKKTDFWFPIACRLQEDNYCQPPRLLPQEQVNTTFIL